MLSPLLLALLPALASPQEAFVTVEDPESIYDLGAVPVASQPLLGPTASFWSRTSRVVQIDLPLAYNPTGLAERFTLGLPDFRAYRGDAVVLFHGLQQHYQVPLQLVQTLNASGYIVIVPQGGSIFHYGSQVSSDITEGVLQWVGERWPLDRLFAYGFSMGGGSSASFVARHPGWFTGLLQHTGTVDLEDSYNLDAPTAQVLDIVYGPPPSFDYERFSTKGTIIQENLAWTPTVTATGSTQDPSWGGLLWPETVTWRSQVAAGVLGPYGNPQHLWINVPFADVVGWLQGMHATPASSGDLVVDRAGRWGLLDVRQVSPGTFSELSYAYQPDRVDLYGVSNVSALDLDVNELQLNVTPGQTLRVHCALVPTASQIILRLRGFSVQPVVQSGPAGSSQWVGGVLVLTQVVPNDTSWTPWVILP